MSRESTVRAGRRKAEEGMTLTLDAYSPDGTTTDADGYDVPAYALEYSTVGRITGDSSKDTETRYVTIGGVRRPVLEGGLHIPVGVTVPKASEQRGIGWEFEVVALGPVDDPALLGRRFLVVSVPVKSHATARRMDVVEV